MLNNPLPRLVALWLIDPSASASHAAATIATALCFGVVGGGVWGGRVWDCGIWCVCVCVCVRARVCTVLNKKNVLKSE